MPTPEHDDVQALWWEYQESHDPRVREELILHYAPLVKYVAGRVGSGLPTTVENADLVSSGIFGLINAIERFEPGRGLKFETYALTRIRGAIIDELRTLDWVPRSVRARSREVERAYVELENELRRAPSDEELAERVGITVQQLQELYANASSTNVAALDELMNSEDGAATLGDTVIDRRVAEPEEAYADEESRDFLAGIVHTLTERERIIIALYYYEGFTLAEIGQVLGVTESRISQLHSKTMIHLRGIVAEAL